jgi:hypothetical protein
MIEFFLTNMNLWIVHYTEIDRKWEGMPISQHSNFYV